MIELKALFLEVNSLAHQLRRRDFLAQQGDGLLAPARNVLLMLAQEGPQTVPAIAARQNSSRQNVQIIANRFAMEGLIEGAILAFIGGIIGCALSFPMHGMSTGTMSFESFSEVVFQFRITPLLVVKGLIFSVIVGLFGSLLPAIRAARLPVIAALKAV